MRWVLENGDEGDERRDWMRGWKTVEDQGVPWMRTRVWRFVEFLGERRAYLIVQPAWWKVEGRLLGADLGGDIFRRWVRCLVDGMYAT
jgi:hypothetical protein